MTTLVTGGAGFIGSAVVRALLAEGRQVRVLVEPGADARALAGLDVEAVEGSTLDPEATRRAATGCSSVFHLAAVYRLWASDPRLIYDVNVIGSRNVLAAARLGGAQRVVFTSSIAAVGWRDSGELADEKNRFEDWDKADAYVRSKCVSEREATEQARAGMPIVIVCPAFPFGEGDRAPTPTGRFIADALDRRIPMVPPGGFCAVDVDDVAACHLAAERHAAVGERVIAGAHNVTYREFFDVVCRVAGLPRIRWQAPRALVRTIGWTEEALADAFGRPPRLTRQSADYACRCVWYDTRKARALGMPVTPLDETVAKAVRWFRA